MISGLSQIFQHNDDTDQPRLVIAIDEAQPLKESQKHFQPAHVLCRAISHYSHSRISTASVWVVFVSTTSKVADFALSESVGVFPPLNIRRALCIHCLTRLVRTHFREWSATLSTLCVTWMGSECSTFTAIPCRWDSKTWQYYFLWTPIVSEVALFLQPLTLLHRWSSLKNGGYAVSDVVNLAEDKLCGAHSFRPSDVNHLLAVLGQRFGLEISSSHSEAVTHVEHGVANHMRVCLATGEDRKWSFTKYPSEPFLSCIAASVLHRSSDTLKSCLETLRRKVDDRLVSNGQADELASRLLWLLAKDILARVEDGNVGISAQLEWGWDAELIDCKRISLIAYLTFLFGARSWPSEALKVFKDAYVNFSHWVEMDAPIATDDDDPNWVR